MDFHIARKKMVAQQLVARGIRAPRVIEAMGRVPRHEFVDPGMAAQAYLDHPLNIGCKQTISQPYIVALMSQALELGGREKVLEIGTGSGYQTAILAELAGQVFSIERVTTLSNRARMVLYRLGYSNLTLRIGDGTVGWPDEAPFDAILVTAGSPSVPKLYAEQLAEGGRLVIPRGDEGSQILIRVRKREGRLEEENLGACRFVKLYGQYGWQA
ncbi:MAG TPA: protein-L-isoaspartate(D-aspartate) O-methyltransferase [bacterium]|nr:protein-L-isoaspartate(D-aspartate) O-methyltransferase [bacterium]